MPRHAGIGMNKKRRKQVEAMPAEEDASGDSEDESPPFPSFPFTIPDGSHEGVSGTASAGAEPGDVDEAYGTVEGVVEAAKAMRKKYASKLKLASKLHVFKMRRFIAAVDSNRGSTTNQLERYHEANTELLEAKFIHAGVRAKVAEQERDAYRALAAALARH